MRCCDCKYRKQCDDVQPDTVGFGECNLKKFADSVDGKWSGKLSEAAGWVSQTIFKELLND